MSMYITTYYSFMECSKFLSIYHIYIYIYQDPATKKLSKVSAPDYVTLLMNWIDDQLMNDDIFPSSSEKPFPLNFETYVKQIFKR
jgi:MOB kinase activator 1